MRSSLSRNIINIPGSRFKRKIVVIESDDWGSIRMPSRDEYTRFVKRGMNLTDSDYNRLDTLESNKDLIALFEVLQGFRDATGRNPVLTANMVVGNPDFQKIRESEFSEYHFELVTETLKRYSGRDQVESLWRQGDDAGIFHPQFHGREHVNVVRWMEALQKRSKEIMFTFDHETTFSGDGDYNFMEVLDYNTPDDMLKMKESLDEGMNLFEGLFGFRSKSFIPPCYTWNSEVEETLFAGGVRYLQGIVMQLLPTGSFGNYKKRYHYLGKRNSFGQYYIIRNSFFEPSFTTSYDPVGECLNRINIAFKWNKPAVISSHRINYMGSLEERNRQNNLQMLSELLKKIQKQWPEVEFMSSDELGDLIAAKKEGI